MYILVMETSTSSAKALLYNKEKKTYQVATQALRKSFSHGENYHNRHDAQKVFDQTLVLAKGLIERERKVGNSEALPLPVDKIVYVTTWHSLILLDRSFNPLTPIYLWSFGMEKPVIGNIEKSDPDLKESFEKRTGCNLSAIYPFWKLYLGLDEGHGIEAAYIGDQSSFGTRLLTGHFVINPMMASGSGFYNPELKDYDDDLLDHIGVKRSQLPPIVSDETTYQVQKSVADYLGISPLSRVSTGVSDGGMNQIYGEAVLKTFSSELTGVTISVGTSGAIRAGLKQFQFQKGMWCYELSDHYVLGGAIGGAGNSLNWIKEILFPNESFVDIEKRILARGLTTDYTYLPFDYGERNPGFYSHGPSGFYDQYGCKIDICQLKENCYKSEAHRLDVYDKVYLALMEGVVYNLYQCYLLMKGVLGHGLQYHLSGGIIKSKLWSGMLCSMFGCHMVMDHMEHASMFGGLLRGLDDKDDLTGFLSGRDYEKIGPDLFENERLLKGYRRYMDLYKERGHV